MRPENATKIGGRIVEDAEESMYERIRAFKAEHPEYVITVDAKLPYSMVKNPNSLILSKAPGLGQMVIHKAIIKKASGEIVSQSSVVQFFHGMYDYPSRVIADAIWYAGEGIGPRYCQEEIEFESEIVHPAERARRRLATGTIQRIMDKCAEAGKRMFAGDEIWYDKLHQDDRKWVIEKGINDLSVHFHVDVNLKQIPEVLRRIGIAGSEKTHIIGGKAVEVVEAFETRWAPKGAIFRNKDLLSNHGFEFNPDRKSKKWAVRIEQKQESQAA